MSGLLHDETTNPRLTDSVTASTLATYKPLHDGPTNHGLTNSLAVLPLALFDFRRKGPTDRGMTDSSTAYALEPSDLLCREGMTDRGITDSIAVPLLKPTRSSYTRDSGALRDAARGAIVHCLEILTTGRRAV